jgi:hypothetical protein
MRAVVPKISLASVDDHASSEAPIMPKLLHRPVTSVGHRPVRHAAQLRAQVEAGAAEQAAALERRLAAFDLNALTALAERVETARAQEAAAHDDFRAALLADPVFGAYIRHRAARHARVAAIDELVQTHHRLGIEPPRIAMQGGVDNRPPDDLAREAAGGWAQLVSNRAPRRDERRSPDVFTVTAPTGERLRVTRDPDSAQQSVIDTATGLPYTPPTRRASPDDGITDHTRMTEHRRSEWSTRVAMP